MQTRSQRSRWRCYIHVRTELTNTLAYSVTVDELSSFPYLTTPIWFTQESIQRSLPSVISIIWWDWMSRLVSQLHICILWPAAEGLQHWWGWFSVVGGLGPVRHICHGFLSFFFVFFDRVEGCDSMCYLQKYGYLKRSTLCSIYLSSSSIHLILFSLSLSHDSCH